MFAENRQNRTPDMTYYIRMHEIFHYLKIMWHVRWHDIPDPLDYLCRVEFLFCSELLDSLIWSLSNYSVDVSMIPAHAYSVSQKNPPWGFVAIFRKRLGIFWPNFTRLLCVPIYARLQIFVQLPATLTILYHIKRDHPVHIMCAKCPPSPEMHAGNNLFLKFFASS